jgi:hypothetical protein
MKDKKAPILRPGIRTGLLAEEGVNSPTAINVRFDAVALEEQQQLYDILAGDYFFVCLFRSILWLHRRSPAANA